MYDDPAIKSVLRQTREALNQPIRQADYDLGMMMSGMGGNAAKFGENLMEQNSPENRLALAKTMAALQGEAGGDWKHKFDPVTGMSVWVNESTGQVIEAPVGESGGYNPVTGSPYGGGQFTGGQETPTQETPTQETPTQEYDLPEAVEDRTYLKSSEDERKTAAALDRLATYPQEIISIVKEDPDAAKPDWIEYGLSKIDPEAANVYAGAPRQKMEAIYAGMVDDILWLVTGAAYNAEQREAAQRRYKPAVGDKPETLKMKRQNLMTFMESQIPRSGRAWTPEVRQRVIQAMDMMYGPESALPEEAAPEQPTEGWGVRRVE